MRAAAIERAVRAGRPRAVLGERMQLTEQQWETVKRAAKYSNGTNVPRLIEVQALKELQKLVSLLDDPRTSL